MGASPATSPSARSTAGSIIIYQRTDSAADQQTAVGEAAELRTLVNDPRYTFPNHQDNAQRRRGKCSTTPTRLVTERWR